MSTSAAAFTRAPVRPIVQIRPVPVREWLPYAIFGGVILFFLIYLVGCDQGATSLVGGHMVHEFVHDARHLLGFPCH
jgi:Probable cobalt transporter subunit (CbtB)